MQGHTLLQGRLGNVVLNFGSHESNKKGKEGGGDSVQLTTPVSSSLGQTPMVAPGGCASFPDDRVLLRVRAAL